jgi:tRNA 2-thiouridine synthesizing protein A
VTPPVIVDSRGTLCPQPVIDLARAAKDAEPGTVIEVLADDPAAATDIPAWCRLRGATFLGTEPFEGATRYLVHVAG